MTSDAQEQGKESAAKAKVFISYSRNDMIFADLLEAALKARGFEPLIDRTAIHAFEDWWKRIEGLIGEADTIISVLSPDAVASEICSKEIDYAAALNKRFAPIVYRQVEVGAVPEPLQRLNFLFFDDRDRFEANADRLVAALKTDIEWIRRHTQFGEQARRWDLVKRPGAHGLLLRPPLLEEAESWLKLKPPTAPEPTQATTALIATSRAVYAEEQAREQARQHEIAQSQANLLATVGDVERERGNLDTALRLSVHATREAQRRSADPSRAAAALASAVCDCHWQLLLSGHEGPVTHATFSPDGKRIVTADRGERDWPPSAAPYAIRIWESATGEETVTRHVPKPEKRLDFGARIWDASTGEQLAVLRGHSDPVMTASFSPDGKFIVTASWDRTARIWEAETASEIAVLRGHNGPVRSAVFNLDGSQILTSSHDNSARIWDARKAREIAVLRGHKDWVNSAAFSGVKGRIITASNDKTARIWDAETANEIALLGGHENWILYAAFNAEATRIVTASSDKTARIWDATTGEEVAVLQHESGVHSAAFSADGLRVITASGQFETDNLVRIWDVTTAKEFAVLHGHEGEVKFAGFSLNEERIVTASNDWTARIWLSPFAKQPEILRGHADAVCSAYFSPDGQRIVTASGSVIKKDNSARIWDVKTAKEIAMLPGHADAVCSASFSPDGTRIITASKDRTARIWDSATARQLAVLALFGASSDDKICAAFSPDGKYILTSQDGQSAHIWDAETGKEITAVGGYVAHSAAFSPDGARIVTSGNGTLRLYDAMTQRQVNELRHTDVGKFAAFSPDGSRIVTTGGNRTARIWDAVQGKEIAMLRGHEYFVEFAAFAPDGERVVTTSWDKTARIWDARTGRELMVLRGHEGRVNCASFSSDGTRLVTAAEDKTARIWDVRFATMSAQALIVEVCSRRLRGITKMTRDEMRLAGYSDDKPQIDVAQI